MCAPKVMGQTWPWSARKPLDTTAPGSKNQIKWSWWLLHVLFSCCYILRILISLWKSSWNEKAELFSHSLSKCVSHLYLELPVCLWRNILTGSRNSS